VFIIMQGVLTFTGHKSLELSIDAIERQTLTACKIPEQAAKTR
jgi:hypothetical protein